MTIAGKNIIVGVCGSVAAYKTAYLVSALVQKKANVTVAMTPAATKFIHPLTFSALSGQKVLTEILSPDYNHLKPANAADLYVIAPATANTIAKLTSGYADNLVTALALSQKGPILICPAMNEKMWLAPVTKQNVKLLKSRGYYLVEPSSGYLACGEDGKGRLAEPGVILEEIEKLLLFSNQLAGVKLLITTGATREYFDEIRFISNPASGLTGFYLADEAAKRGADVYLVAGATTVDFTLAPQIKYYTVVSAEQMRQKVKQLYPQVAAVIMAAAVSDFTPATKYPHKVKKQQLSSVQLQPAPDILKELGANKEGKILIGFAAQTNNWLKEGQAKLKEKNLDLIVVTDVSNNQGFGRSPIKSWFVFPHKEKSLGLINKRKLATALIEELVGMLKK